MKAHAAISGNYGNGNIAQGIVTAHGPNTNILSGFFHSHEPTKTKIAANFDCFNRVLPL